MCMCSDCNFSFYFFRIQTHACSLTVWVIQSSIFMKFIIQFFLLLFRVSMKKPYTLRIWLLIKLAGDCEWKNFQRNHSVSVIPFRINNVKLLFCWCKLKCITIVEHSTSQKRNLCLILFYFCINKFIIIKLMTSNTCWISLTICFRIFRSLSLLIYSPYSFGKENKNFLRSLYLKTYNACTNGILILRFFHLNGIDGYHGSAGSAMFTARAAISLNNEKSASILLTYSTFGSWAPEQSEIIWFRVFWHF